MYWEEVGPCYAISIQRTDHVEDSDIDWDRGVGPALRGLAEAARHQSQQGKKKNEPHSMAVVVMGWHGCAVAVVVELPCYLSSFPVTRCAALLNHRSLRAVG